MSTPDNRHRFTPADLDLLVECIRQLQRLMTQVPELTDEEIQYEIGGIAEDLSSISAPLHLSEDRYKTHCNEEIYEQIQHEHISAITTILLRLGALPPLN
jgi:hypothetical protein